METGIVLMVAALVIFGAVQAVRRNRKGSACCGEHEKTVRKLRVSDRNRSHYPFAVTLEIGGMTCDACARSVENALNSLEGTWARVSLADHEAHVLLKQEPDENMLRTAVRRSGYVVTGCRTERQVTEA